jgi:hypothetical protein
LATKFCRKQAVLILAKINRRLDSGFRLEGVFLVSSQWQRNEDEAKTLDLVENARRAGGEG